MWTIGKREGWPVTLYDPDGQGICNKERLEEVVGEVPYGETCYVVSAEARW